MDIRRLPIAQLTPAHYNPRKDLKPGDEEYELLKKGIGEFGLVEPLVWNEATGRLVGGHQRLKVLIANGETEADVSVVHIEDEAREKALNIALNKVGGDWDRPALKDLLEELDTGALDMELTGFTEDALAELMSEFHVVPDADPDDFDADAEAAQITEPTAKRGDVWVLGRHRLMCGDSTCATDVERLMDGKRAQLMATDPPYGVAYGVETGASDKYDAIANDENDGPKLQAFLEDCFRTWLPYVDENAAWYLWHAQLTQGFFAAAAAAADILIHRQIIWVKPSLILGHGDYHWRHELCFYGWRTGHRANWYGDRKQTTVWEIGRENDKIHPTQKPVECFAIPIGFNTKHGEICAEPFSGSGSQIIAAEQTGRICYAMEIEPRYVDVAVKRWEQYTGQTARLAE